MLLPTANVRVELGDLDVGEVLVVRLSGAEELSALFELEVEAVFTDATRPGLADLLGAEITVVFSVDDQDVRSVHGLVVGTRDQLAKPAVLPSWVTPNAAGQGGRTVILRVAPRAHRLSLVAMQDVFVDMALPDILRKKLELAGFAEDLDFDLRLVGTYPERELTVQYKETDLSFIRRLAEDAGISFFFEHTSGRDKLVFTDHNAGLGDGLAVVHPFETDGGLGVFELSREERLIPAVFAVQDYNYRAPLVDVAGQHELEEGFGGGVVEFAPHAKTPDEATRVARLRAEEARAGRDLFVGKSALVAVEPGGRFVLDGHPIVSRELLVTRVEHAFRSLSFAGSGQAAGPSYTNAFVAIASDVPHRPRRSTPKPRIHGFVTGLVEPVPSAEGKGARDAKPRIDQLGRYWVRFHFDTAAPGEQKASHPIRMAQSHAGAGYGMHFPLRPGVEVLLAFLDGDPDRPVIVGAVPNALTPSPVVAANASLNQIVTSSGVSITIRDF